MTTRYPARGTSKEKDAKFDESGIFKLFSPAEESMAHTDSITMLDKQLGQKALHLPPLRVKTVRINKSAASLRGITSESLKQILKESIHFSERLSDVQQSGPGGDSLSQLTQCLMHQHPQLQSPSLLVPAPPQTKLMTPVDVKNFQLSLAPPATMGRVGKPSRLVVSNQNSVQNGIQPVAAKPNTPSGLLSQGTLRASSRGKKVAVKYFGFDKSDQAEGSADNRSEAVADSARSQISVTCFDFKPTSNPHMHVPALRRGSDQDVHESRPSHTSSSEPHRPTTSNTKVSDTS
jgi:hypothetical protein